MDPIYVDVITATTLSQPYIACAPIWVEFWTPINSHEITFSPKLIVVEANFDHPSPGIELEGQETLAVSDKYLVTASQVCRILAAAFSNATYVMTTDVDMIPLNSEYFGDMVRKAIETNAGYFIARDVLDSNQYPICYTLIKPEVIREQLEKLGILGGDLGETVKRFFSAKLASSPQSVVQKRDPGWYSDQAFLRKLADDWGAGGGVVFKDDWYARRFRRLDRLFHHSRLSALWSWLASRDYFVDYHMHYGEEARSRILNALRRCHGPKAIQRNGH